MSHGSWFEILRDDNGKIADKQFINNFLKQHDEILNDSLSQKKKTLEDVQDYFVLNEKQHTCINIKNGKLYIQIMEICFNSQFDCLTEFYNMNAYNKRCQIKISLRQARMIVQAINYINSKKYDEEFEQILDNPYLQAFACLYPVFFNRFKDKKQIEDFKNDSEYKYQCELAINVFKRSSVILNAYISMVEQDYSKQNEYLLIYNCY